jgi:hypothetical protein
MDFRITGLSVAPFAPLFRHSDAELGRRNILRRVCDAKPSFPCRVSMAEAEPGETVLLLHYEHQPAASPYRAAGPIYVRETARETFNAVNAVPDVVRERLISLRAYDSLGMIVDAEVTEGKDIEPVIRRLFANGAVEYLHAHNARRGCYSCRIDRA